MCHLVSHYILFALSVYSFLYDRLALLVGDWRQEYFFSSNVWVFLAFFGCVQMLQIVIDAWEGWFLPDDV